MLSFAVLLAALLQDEEPYPFDLLFRGGPAAPRPQAVGPSLRWHASRPDYYDRRTIADLGGGAADLLHLGLRDDGGDAWALRAAKWGLSIWFDAAARHTVHEYGHIASFSRAGFHRAVMGEAGTPAAQREDASIGKIFADGLGRTEGSGLSLPEEDWTELRRRFEGRPRDFNRFWLTVESGGLNQEQVLAARYVDRLHEGRLSPLDGPSYLRAAFATISYSTRMPDSDITDYRELLETEGREVSASRIKLLSAVRFFGGTGLAGIYGGVEGAFGGDGGPVEPLAVEVVDDLRLLWPEFESYLTLAGPTLRTSIPLLAAGVTLLPSYERSFASTGDVVHEAGLRARAPFFDGLLWLDGSFLRSDEGGTWRTIEAELRPLPWFSLLLGVEAGRGYTFRRDVFGTREEYVEGAERSLILGLRLTLVF